MERRGGRHAANGLRHRTNPRTTSQENMVQLLYQLLYQLSHTASYSYRTYYIYIVAVIKQMKHFLVTGNWFFISEYESEC